MTSKYGMNTSYHGPPYVHIWPAKNIKCGWKLDWPSHVNSVFEKHLTIPKLKEKLIGAKLSLLARYLWSPLVGVETIGALLWCRNDRCAHILRESKIFSNSTCSDYLFWKQFRRFDSYSNLMKTFFDHRMLIYRHIPPSTNFLHNLLHGPWP